jgi:hypothetical protein
MYSILDDVFSLAQFKLMSGGISTEFVAVSEVHGEGSHRIAQRKSLVL